MEVLTQDLVEREIFKGSMNIVKEPHNHNQVSDSYIFIKTQDQDKIREEAIERMIKAQNEYLKNSYWKFPKRFFDIIVSCFVVIFVLSWLVPLLFIAIKLESKGPFIFKQKRNGEHMKPFVCYKFRSMRLNDESNTKPTSKEDERITRMGYFMRRYSIDELPQFLNVLKGEMSVVGPRPHMISETNRYNEISNVFYLRHRVRPGITGLAQINKCRGEISCISDLNQRIRYDLSYIRNASFLYDFKLVVNTIFHVFYPDEKAR